MANLSDDTLHKILQQIQTQALISQRSLSTVQTQLNLKNREKRTLQLTSRLLNEIPEKTSSGNGQGEEVKMFRGVGKAFIMESRRNVMAAQANEDKALSEDIANLGKKAKFLEKQLNDAQGQLKDIFHSQNRES